MEAQGYGLLWTSCKWIQNDPASGILVCGLSYISERCEQEPCVECCNPNNHLSPSQKWMTTLNRSRGTVLQTALPGLTYDIISLTTAKVVTSLLMPRSGTVITTHLTSMQTVGGSKHATFTHPNVIYEELAIYWADSISFTKKGPSTSSEGYWYADSCPFSTVSESYAHQEMM